VNFLRPLAIGSFGMDVVAPKPHDSPVSRIAFSHHSRAAFQN
jgi:hypothetical protein